MDNETKFWIYVFGVIAVIVSCVTIYSVTSNNVVKEMVLKGANPIAAACAIRSMSGSLCAAPDVLANRNK